MNKLTLDSVTIAKLLGREEVLEICNDSGQTVGVFHAISPTLETSPDQRSSPFTAEEIERRRSQRTGSSLSDVLDRLRQL